MPSCLYAFGSDGICFLVLPLGEERIVEQNNLYSRTITAMRVALDEETFATVWAAGRAMTLEQAISYALEEPSSRTA